MWVISIVQFSVQLGINQHELIYSNFTKPLEQVQFVVILFKNLPEDELALTF